MKLLITSALHTTEPNFFKRLYYKVESLLLKRYQLTLINRCIYTCLSQSDVALFKQKYQLKNVHFIPGFIPWQNIKSKEGKGSYCLYHGNLSVAENIKAVEWLVHHIFSELQVPFIIAGKNPSHHLYQLVKNYKHIQIIPSPNEAVLNDLIQNAHIHVIPSFNQTGVKLKLLNVLFNGRFCVTNAAGIEGSGIAEGVLIANNAADFRNVIEQTFLKSFTEKDIVQRTFIEQLYDNKKNAEKLIELW